MADEADSAVRFVEAVLQQCGAFRRVTFFAVLDTVSTSQTLVELRSLAEREPRLNALWVPENRCVVDAYVAGYRAALDAGCDWILEIDSGFSHRPEELPQFFRTMSQGYDCVFGSRFCKGGEIKGDSTFRHIVSKGGTLLAQLLLGARLSDMTSGYELFSRAALQQVLARGIKSRAHFFQTEIKMYCHVMNIAEVPIHYDFPSPRLRRSAVLEAFQQLGRLFLLRLRGNLPNAPGKGRDGHVSA
jgi:dolichol-phosphate mannosyltransferase